MMSGGTRTRATRVKAEWTVGILRTFAHAARMQIAKNPGSSFAFLRGDRQVAVFASAIGSIDARPTTNAKRAARI